MAESLRIGRIGVDAYTIPTDFPEADGTIEWDATSMVVVEIDGGGRVGLGYSYAAPAAARLVRDTLAPMLRGGDAMAPPALYDRMLRAVRNIGRAGAAACALSAVDVALWDLKARLLDLPLGRLLGERRESVPIYGSGGFTTYDDRRTVEQFSGWRDVFGPVAMKMKVGAEPGADPARVRAVRDALPDVPLMVDANGAFARKPALAFAERVAELGVVWFEEPVSSDDLAGLRLLRDRAPAGMDVAAGEYAYDPWYVQRMAAAGAVDVMQLDATRCGGVTGFMAAAAVADAHHLPVSAHTAPALHLPVCLAAPRLRHAEWFHDHARIEAMLFDGAPRPADGVMTAADARPGHGLAFKRADAARFAV